MKQNLLLWIGVAGIVLGAVISYSSKDAAEASAFRKNMDGAAMGYMWDFQPDYTGMWVGIIIAALGVIAILLHVYATTKNPRDSSEGAARGR